MDNTQNPKKAGRKPTGRTKRNLYITAKEELLIREFLEIIRKAEAKMENNAMMSRNEMWAANKEGRDAAERIIKKRLWIIEKEECIQSGRAFKGVSYLEVRPKYLQLKKEGFVFVGMHKITAKINDVLVQYPEDPDFEDLSGALLPDRYLSDIKFELADYREASPRIRVVYERELDIYLKKGYTLKNNVSDAEIEELSRLPEVTKIVKVQRLTEAPGQYIEAVLYK